MYRKTKREQELEAYINNQSLKALNTKHNNQSSGNTMLNNKREREQSPLNKTSNTKQKPITATPTEQIEKIFLIANKHQSLIKCIKLIKIALLKTYNDHNKSLFAIIVLLYRIDRLSFKAIDMSTNQTIYKDIYQYVTDEIVFQHNLSKEKDDINEEDEYALEIIEAFRISFEFMGELFTDDSFGFNAAIKRINESILSLPDYSPNEKDNESLGSLESIRQSLKDKESNFQIVSIKRTMLFNCYESMVYSRSQMKTSIIQSYSSLMVNKEKLSLLQQKRLNELIKTIKDNKNSTNSTKMNEMDRLDSKTKSNPLESYYEVNDAREEKYIIFDANKWESKQNGLESTKQYLG